MGHWTVATLGVAGGRHCSDSLPANEWGAMAKVAISVGPRGLRTAAEMPAVWSNGSRTKSPAGAKQADSPSDSLPMPDTPQVAEAKARRT